MVPVRNASCPPYLPSHNQIVDGRHMHAQFGCVRPVNGFNQAAFCPARSTTGNGFSLRAFFFTSTCSFFRRRIPCLAMLVRRSSCPHLRRQPWR
jgi:hypothetical protein